MRLRDGRTLTAAASGARGYPSRPATDTELAAKFLSCASRALSEASAKRALDAISDIDRAADIRAVAALLGRDRASTP